jgi:CBS-domain-containing membrane protein
MHGRIALARIPQDSRHGHESARRAGVHVIPLEPLRVQFRETIRVDGSVHQERFAFCHNVSSWVSLAHCKACVACAHLSGEAEPVLVCRAAPAGSSTPPDSIRSQLARAVWCIEDGAPARLACIMPTTQADAIVVDADGHAVGILSRQRARRAPGDALARTVMEPGVVALFDGAGIEQARELLTTRGVKTLPVLSAGRVVGRVRG